MIKSLTVTNPKGESLKIELLRPELSGLIIKSIDGLGPPTASISSSEIATMDGALYVGSRLETRNIVITFLMGENPSVEVNRLKTYQYFPTKRPITLQIETDTKTAQIQGYVESNEPEIFSEQEETKISIVCLDPYFYDADKTIINFSDVIPKFEFAFENNNLTSTSGYKYVVNDVKNAQYNETFLLPETSIGFTTGSGDHYDSISVVLQGAAVIVIQYGATEVAGIEVGLSGNLEYTNESDRTITFDTAPTGELLAWLNRWATNQTVVTAGADKIEMSEIRVDMRSLIVYPGDGDTGLLITIQMYADVAKFDMYNTFTNGSMKFVGSKLPSSLGTTFKKGDILEISTKKGDKYVTLIRSGVRNNAITCLQRNPEWFQLTPGDNIFSYDADDGDNDENVSVTFTYYVAYEGV